MFCKKSFLVYTQYRLIVGVLHETYTRVLHAAYKSSYTRTDTSQTLSLMQPYTSRTNLYETYINPKVYK
ncbi:hypothetical protein HanIR_Chr09g0408931 [Helianthus annuus]|nr:hypothetical protein HanIR_Chr09g0408931 [Helianthus annuus]